MTLRPLRIIAVALLAAAACAPLAATPAAAHPHGSSHLPSWHLTDTGTDAQFRGLSAVSRDVAWVSGTEGTVLRTTNRGRTWSSVGPAGAEALELRDIEAFDSRHAVALSIGTGTDSRVYVTADGGATWKQSFTNDDPNAFYDCMTFSDRQHGLALSDPPDGRFRIIATSDGGRHWKVLSNAGMPDALPGEFAFAASGTCLVSAGHEAYFATGGSTSARVFRSHDGGRNWQVTSTDFTTGPSAGIYSLAFADPWRGIAVGGDFTTPDTAPDSLALTINGGRNWYVNPHGPNEYRSGAAFADWHTVLAVGPTGSDISVTGGLTWTRFDDGTFDGVQCAHGSCWASGSDGRVAWLSR